MLEDTAYSRSLLRALIVLAAFPADGTEREVTAVAGQVEFGLPTFGVDGASWYCRLTLVVNDGAIAQVFYPVMSAVRSPAQAVAWMRRQRWV